MSAPRHTLAAMRFLHTADWQLGMTRHFLEGEAQPRYSAARRDAVAGLGALAEKTGAEFVVVAGDVFESNQLAPKVISQSLEAMRAIGVPVYLLPGNHDPLDASSVYTSALFKAECPDNIVVLDRDGIWDVRPGVQLVVAPWRSKAPTTDLVGAVLKDLPADGTTRIVVAHGGVDVLDPDTAKPSLIRMAGLSEALDRGAVHYVALGDKHSRTCVGDSGRIWYSGSPPTRGCSTAPACRTRRSAWTRNLNVKHGVSSASFCCSGVSIVWLIRLTKTLTDALPRALDCNRDATGQFPGLEIALEWLAPRMHLITSRKHRAPLLRLGTPEKAKLIIINK